MKKQLLTILIVSITMVLYSQNESGACYYKTKTAVFEKTLNTYPDDPTSDIAWQGGLSTISDIEAAFNNARTQENNQLGIALPMINFPSQVSWDNMSDNAKMLWLINEERIARGVLPLKDFEYNVTNIASYYAQYLVDNDAWGHSEDGNTPWERLETNTEINACHDFLGIAENLSVFVSSSNNFQSLIARAFYNWMYKDGDCCTWGHRHAIVWNEYTNNSGSDLNEGFVGVGHAYGVNYTGPFSQSWNYVEMIVMNVFDPCDTWIASDIDNVEYISNISISPNPTSNYFCINIKEEVLKGVEIYDFTGKLVKSINQLNVNISYFNKGIYIVKINTDINNYSMKLVVD